MVLYYRTCPRTGSSTRLTETPVSISAWFLLVRLRSQLRVSTSLFIHNIYPHLIQPIHKLSDIEEPLAVRALKQIPSYVGTSRHYFISYVPMCWWLGFLNGGICFPYNTSYLIVTAGKILCMPTDRRWTFWFEIRNLSIDVAHDKTNIEVNMFSISKRSGMYFFRFILNVNQVVHFWRGEPSGIRSE